MKKYSVKINGMGGDHCIRVITNIINKQDGAAIDNIEVGRADFSIDETKTNKEAVVAAIEKMGYTVER